MIGVLQDETLDSWHVAFILVGEMMEDKVSMSLGGPAGSKESYIIQALE